MFTHVGSVLQGPLVRESFLAPIDAGIPSRVRQSSSVSNALHTTSILNLTGLAAASASRI